MYEMATLKHAFNAKDMNSLVYKILRGKVCLMLCKLHVVLLKRNVPFLTICLVIQFGLLYSSDTHYAQAVLARAGHIN